MATTKDNKKQKIGFVITTVLIALLALWMQSIVLFLVLTALCFDYYFVHILFWYRRKPRANNVLRSVLVAILAALFFRAFFVEIYTIPTSSMEKTLLVGDYLFVSKLSYGPKIANTPISVPFLHSGVPFTNWRSFSEKLYFKYKRLRGFGQIQQGDAVVFNFPEGDTVLVDYKDQNYYSLKRLYGHEFVNSKFETDSRPIDRRENYIKRCVGLPGDNIEISNGLMYVNEVVSEINPNLQYDYFVLATDSLPTDTLRKYKLSYRDIALAQNFYKRETYSRAAMSFVALNDPFKFAQISSIYILPLTPIVAVALKKQLGVVAVKRFVNPKGYRNDLVFPHEVKTYWNEDNFGPIEVPAKGKTVPLNLENLARYRRIIDIYEGNDLSVVDGNVMINGKVVSFYTFKMDYYFMMGDNRHNSADSRYWGFVPEDHVVGKAARLWFSIDKNKTWLAKFRFNRFLNKIE